MSANEIVVDHPPRRNQEAGRAWAFVAIDSDGNESVCGRATAFGATPMFSDTWETIERMRPHAQRMARQFRQYRVVLRCYSQATDIETL
jgi:hypothetical protein